MNKFPVPLLRQLLGCMQDGLSIRVTAQKLGISQSSVSHLFQTLLSHSGSAKVAELLQLPDTQLLETFYPPTTKAYQGPDWVEVHKKLARRNVTLKLLYDAYKSQVVRRAYTYTSFYPVTQSGGKPTALAYPTATSKSSTVSAWWLTSLETTSSGLIRTVTNNVCGCLSRCCRTATTLTLRPFPMRSNRAGSPASVTHSNNSAARRRSSLWTMQRHSSSTRAGTRAKFSRRYVPCTTTMTLSHGRVSLVVTSRKTGSRPV